MINQVSYKRLCKYCYQVLIERISIAMSLGQEPQYKTPKILNKGTSLASDTLET